jgi:hypothetical protein
MCYEWRYWKSQAEKTEKRDQPVSERKPVASQPAPTTAAPPTKKPDRVETELEPV